jgi:hypothetical protein
MHRAKIGFIRDMPAGVPASRGLETCDSPWNAKLFADQAAIDSFLASMNGPANTWVAVTIP